VTPAQAAYVALLCVAPLPCTAVYIRLAEMRPWGECLLHAFVAWMQVALIGAACFGGVAIYFWLGDAQ